MNICPTLQIDQACSRLRVSRLMGVGQLLLLVYNSSSGVPNDYFVARH